MMQREGSARPATDLLWLPAWTLCQREITRFLRQRGRIIGAVGTPLIFWLMFGGGLYKSFKLDGVEGSYLEFTFPGAVAAILLFTAIFSMITVIDDRDNGFMQGVLVAPVSRVAIVLGKVMGATVLAVGQAMLFLLLAPLAGLRPGVIDIVAMIGAMVVLAVGVCGLGFWIAWRMETTQGFHAIMNLVLMPMLALSGAFFPITGASRIVAWLMTINPMTYGVALLRCSFGGVSEDLATNIHWTLALGVSAGFAVLMMIFSLMTARRAARQAAV